VIPLPSILIADRDPVPNPRTSYSAKISFGLNFNDSINLEIDRGNLRWSKIQMLLECRLLSAIRFKVEKNQPKSLARKKDDVGISVGEKSVIIEDRITWHLEGDGI
jgi:hypothetical protein